MGQTKSGKFQIFFLLIELFPYWSRSSITFNLTHLEKLKVKEIELGSQASHALGLDLCQLELVCLPWSNLWMSCLACKFLYFKLCPKIFNLKRLRLSKRKVKLLLFITQTQALNISVPLRLKNTNLCFIESERRL